VELALLGPEVNLDSGVAYNRQSKMGRGREGRQQRQRRIKSKEWATVSTREGGRQGARGCTPLKS
jgi:hypothetical protein